MKTRTIKIGEVGVDSGQLIICDPCYIASEFLEPNSAPYSDHAHTVYKNIQAGKLWQFTYGRKPSVEGANQFPGSYDTVIPNYGMTPNQLKKEGLFIPLQIDPKPHVPNGEFSYRGICKATDGPNQSGQLNYLLGHSGVAVAFNSGFGDGTYEVFAEIGEVPGWGERVKSVRIELITEADLAEEEE